MSSLVLKRVAGAVLAAVGIACAGPAQAQIARDDVGFTAIQDTSNAWPWVGQMVDWRLAPTLSFGLCTGQAINPRVVLFAAHCHGGVANTELYGVGGYNMAFMFNPNNLSAVRQYVGLDPSSTPIGVSNEGNNVYRVIDIVAHPLNAANAFTAGNADISLAALDQPIDGFNGYGMLFSPLTALERVEIVGYGNRGTMSSGQIGIDWWRRAGENMLGMLGSDNDVFAADLFGNSPPSPGGWDGDLYWLDSDSHLVPRPAGDYNIFGGAALPFETGISQGSSGGAMWIRRGGVPIALGVASYGYSFGPNSFGHGTITTHTPLFAYWDFIVANNPYVYAAAKPGGGAWESGATWVQMLDPNYLIFGPGGTVVNGLPTGDPVADQGGAPNVGGPRPLPLTPVPNGAVEAVPTGERLGMVGYADADDLDGPIVAPAENAVDFSAAAQPSAATSPVSAPSVVAMDYVPAVAGSGSGFWPVGVAPLSGPGSTNFVPDNTYGSIGVQFANPARFFEVQLVSAGTVTLSSSRTIDRLRVLSGSAGLTINSTGDLTTLLSSSVEAGTLRVDGLLRARRIGLFGGVLTGSGLMQTSGGVGVWGAAQQAGELVMTGGVLAPGTVGGVGDLSLEGSALFVSGLLSFDVTSATTYDRFLVTNLAGTSGGPNGVIVSPLSGTLPQIEMAWAGGYLPSWGDSFDILSASGGLSGDFDVIDNLAGVLYPDYSVVGTLGVVSVEALPFVDATPGMAPEQNEVGRALDALRAAPGGYDAFPGLFGSLDYTPLEILPRTLESMVPLNGLAAGGWAEAAAEQSSRAVDARTEELTRRGGLARLKSFATRLFGRRDTVQIASAGDPDEATAVGLAALAARGMGDVPQIADGSRSWEFAPGWGGFLSAGTLVDAGWEVTPWAGDADLQSFTAVAGIDRSFAGGRAVLGAAATYSTGESTIPAFAQTVDAESAGLVVYGAARRGAWSVHAQASAARQDYDLQRTPFLPLDPQTLVASTDGTVLRGSLEIGRDFDVADGLLVVSSTLEGARVEIDGYAESGGTAAVAADDMSRTHWSNTVAGAYEREFVLSDGGVLRPSVRAGVGVGLSGDDPLMTAVFKEFPATVMTFEGSERDDVWLEYEVGVAYDKGNTTVSAVYSGSDDGRLDFSAVSARISIRW